MLAEFQVEASHGLESLFRREDSSHDYNDTGNEDRISRFPHRRYTETDMQKIDLVFGACW